MRPRISALFVAAMGLGCSAYVPAEPLGSAPVEAFAVLAPDQLRSEWSRSDGCDAGAKEGLTPTWLVPDLLARRLGPNLRRRLATAIREGGPSKLREEDYLLQYVGVTFEGKEAILVIGIHKELAQESDAAGSPNPLGMAILAAWHTRLVFVCDAGRLQFWVLLDEFGQPVGPIRFFPAFGGGPR